MPRSPSAPGATRPSTAWLALCVAALLLACGGEDAQRYSVRGQVVRIADAGRSLVVDHEDIPGFMGRMRMTLPLQDAAAAEGLEPGDKIAFEFFVSRGTGSIGAIEELPEDTPLELAPPPR